MRYNSIRTTTPAILRGARGRINPVIGSVRSHAVPQTPPVDTVRRRTNRPVPLQTPDHHYVAPGVPISSKISNLGFPLPTASASSIPDRLAG